MKKVLILVIGAAIMCGAGAYAQTGDMDTCPMCKGKGMMEKGMMPPPPQMQGQRMQQCGCPMMNPEGMGPGMQGQGKQPGMKMGQMQRKMMQDRMKQEMRQDRMCMTKCMIGRREMVATSDGGVIVSVGNKLYKYDKDLKLKGEAEIKMDMEAMKKMREEMKKTREEMIEKEPRGKMKKDAKSETRPMAN